MACRQIDDDYDDNDDYDYDDDDDDDEVEDLASVLSSVSNSYLIYLQVKTVAPVITLEHGDGDVQHGWDDKWRIFSPGFLCCHSTRKQANLEHQFSDRISLK